MVEPPPRTPHIFRDLMYHSYYRQSNLRLCRHQVKHPCPLTTVRGSCATLLHSRETSIYSTISPKEDESQTYIRHGLHLHLP